MSIVNDTDPFPEIAADNDRALKKLSRAIANSQGHFAPILVRCNYTLLAERILQRLEAMDPLPLHQLHLPESVETLYTTLQAELGTERPQALLVFGLESAIAIDRILTSTNQVREEFRKNFPFPLVLWVNDDLLQKLTRFAPDFKSWAAIPIKFEMPVPALLEGLQRTMDGAFAALLDVGAGKFIESASIPLPAGSLRLVELETALDDLERCREGLDPELEANLQFLIGREAELKGDRQKARACYECSFQHWQDVVKAEEKAAPALERYGCLLFHLGLWWRQEAIRNRTEYEASCQKAREYYRRCLEALQKSDRPELEQRFINALGEVLTRLEAWEELKGTAERAVSLHRAQQDSVRLAYGYGLLAEVALHEGKGTEAKRYAELALQSNEEPSTLTGDWGWDKQHYCNYYRLLLARSQRQLGRGEEAIANLAAARADSFPEGDPLLYIRILENLRSLQFERGEYLEAFKTKQEQQSIEQQFEFKIN